MAADSTTLVDEQRPGHSTKLEKLKELIEQLTAETERKVVLFSEWTQMLSSTFAFLEKLLPAAPEGSPAADVQNTLQKQFAEGLSQCVKRDDEGRPTLELTLPDEDSLQNLAASFARFASLAQTPPPSSAK